MALSLASERVLPPETIRPSQFAAIWYRRATTPERDLIRAILEQAVSDLRCYRYAQRRRKQRLYVDAYGWITSEDRSHPFTFVNICEALGLSSGALRKGLTAPKPPIEAAAPEIQQAAA